MSSHSQPLSPHDETIEAMAAAWLAQRDDGLTAEEQADFDRWQKKDPRHAAAVARLEQTWKALQQLREFRPESKVHPNRDLLAGSRPPGQIFSFPVAAAVVGLAAALVLGALVWWPHPAAVRPIEQSVPEFATTTDGYQRVTLKDGSILELNANSLARVEFTPGERRVQLVRGEGHFTVAKDAQRPFIVRADTVSVRAVGTAFNVRLNERDVEVLVTEGHVKVENHATTNAVASAKLPELGPGQRLMVSTKAAADAAPFRVDVVPPEIVQESLAWQGPRLRFVDTPLASVVAQFNRHNQIQIELGDDSLMNVPVDGSFRSENVEAFIRLLETDRSIVAERVGKERIILRKAP